MREKIQSVIRKKENEKRPWALLTLLAVLLVCLLTVPVSAQLVRADSADGTSAGEVRIQDEAGLLTSGEEEELRQACQDFAEKRGCSICFLSVGDEQLGADHTEEDDQKYIKDFCEQSFGAGSDSIGLLVDMDFRYYYLDIMGSHALQVYTNAKQQKIQNSVEEKLAEDDCAGAALAFVQEADDWYGADEDPDPKTGSYLVWTLVSIGVAALIVFLWYCTAAKKHREQQVAAEAAAYVQPGSFQLSRRQDRFIRSYVTRVARPKSNESGGGTTTHSSGSGTSHSGGGGHF